jgi:WD40 repeat protein/nucleoside phosphorylase
MSGARVDVLIVTALKDELDAVLEIEINGKGREAWKDARDQSGFPYHRRELLNDHEEKLGVAAAWSGEMGGDAAAVRAVGLILELNPGCLAMCGICAGWRGNVFLGDVIVADRVFSYDSGKQVTGSDGHDGFFHDIATYNLEATWKMDAEYFAREFQRAPRLKKERPLSKESQARWLLHRLDEHERHSGPSPLNHPDRKMLCPDWTARIKALRKEGLIADTPGELRLTEQGRRVVADAKLLDPEGQERDPDFRVHVAPIATGSAVREEPGLFDRLSRHIRKVLGAEMEARAIGFAAEQLGRRRSIIVKAVSDYADHDKDDAYRSFACHASAVFLLAFLQKHLRPESPSRIPAPMDEEHLEPEPEALGEEGRRYEEFLAHVERACMLRHPEGTRITWREAAPPFRRFLEVAVAEGRFVRVFPVAAIEQSMTEETLQAFLKGIHQDYQRLNPAVRSTLVHAGSSAPEELARKAFAQNVWLTSFGEYQGLFDFSAYLQRQTTRLESDPIYPPALYVEQRAQVSIGGQEAVATSDVLGSLRELLDSPHPRFALVLGDFGAGKTFLLHELARRMAREQGPLVPVLIEMRSLQKHRSLKALIAQHFAAADVGRLEPDQFLYMLQEGRIALLFDGFDELALRVTYDQVMEHFGTLIEAAQGQAKVIVTSRTQHFLKDHDVKRELGERAAMLPGYRLIKLERFSQEQVRRFLEKRLGSEAAASERMALLRDVRDLLGLSENPRLLGFIAELDAESLRAARARSGKITSAKLYELLINRWLEGEHHRVNPMGAPKGLSVQQLRRGAAELAMLLWERTERSVDIKELPSELIAAVRAHGEHALDEGVIRHQLGSGSLLVRDEEGRFSFIHQSVLEWLVADAAARAVSEGRDAAVLGRREMSDLMADFFIDLGGTEAAGGWVEATLSSVKSDAAQKNALRIRRRLHETQADQGTARRVHRVRRNLEGRDLRGEDLSGADLSGANLRGANLSGVTLVKADLSEARLSQASLVRANLERAVLSKAELTGANLSGARLLGADLRGTKLQGARLYATKLVGASVDSLAGAELFGAALPEPGSITPSLGLASSINALAFSSTGELLATAHADGTIGIWDVETGQALRILEGRTDRSLAFSPDGRTLAAGSTDGTVRLWSVEQGTCLHTLQGHAGYVRSVVFSPDGQTLASGSEDGTLRLWSVEHGASLRTLLGQTKYLLSVAFSPDGRMLASGSEDGTIRLWSVEQGARLSTLQGHADYVRSVVFSPDGRMLASGSTDGTVRLWSVEQGAPLRVLRGHKQYVLSVAFSPDGRTVNSGSADGTVCLWSLEQDMPLHTLQGQSQYVRTMVFSPDGRTLALGSSDGVVRLWSVEQGVHLRTLYAYVNDGVRNVAFSLNGRTVALGSADGTLCLWGVEWGGPSRILRGHTKPIRSVAFSVDGRMLASASSDGTIRLWSVEHGEALRTLQGLTGAVQSMAFSPDGRILAGGSADMTVRLWSVEQGAPLHILREHTKSVRSVAFSPDGRVLASGSSDGTVWLWSVEQGAPVRTLQGHTDDILSVAFSPDGRTLASGADDRTIRIWSVEQGALLRTLKGHTKDVRSVAFSPDGTMLASGSTDGTIWLWSVEEGTLLRTLRGHAQSVLSVAFGSAGTLLAAAFGDGTARFWDPSTGRHLATSLGGLDGWVAFRPDGRFKGGGHVRSAFWHTIGLCRFEPDELDPYLPTPLRIPDNEPLLPGA